MLETILPFLKPVAHLIEDPDVSEVMINGSGSVFYQSNGRLHELPDAKLDQGHLEHAAKRIAHLLGKDISEAKPLLDARLEDGSRVSIVFPPTSLHGITFDIRKFRPQWFTLAQLVEAQALPESLASQLAEAVRDRQTILIVGGTDTGKSTFAKALIDFIPLDERLGVIEDTAELKVDHPNVFRFEAREEQRNPLGEIVLPAVTIRDLIKTSLRQRPDRLIIGEVRGAEAFDLLDALNTGHSGSISTLHANSALQGLSRLASLALRANVEIPHKALQAEIGDLIDIVVHVERHNFKRRVSEVISINRFDPDRNAYDFATLYSAHDLKHASRAA